MLAKVNGNQVKAYVDLGSQCVTIRRENADRVETKYTVTEKPLTIGGYGSGSMTPCGETNVNITVGLATAAVPVLIVPNESQAIPIIVGQPFTEQPHVTIWRCWNTVRIFEEEKNVGENDDTLQSIEVPDILRRPANLRTKESTVVPTNYVALVKLYVTGSELNADVSVDAQLRCQEGREHCIPRSVLDVDAVNETCIPAMDVSYQELNIKCNERVAQTEVCYLAGEPMQDVKSSCSTTQSCSTASANVRTGPSVIPEIREKLERLNAEHRDCFADSVTEIGRTTAAEMKIEILPKNLHGFAHIGFLLWIESIREDLIALKQQRNSRQENSRRNTTDHTSSRKNCPRTDIASECCSVQGAGGELTSSSLQWTS
ncbi:hypothetical protein MTO96_023420 [Rhipicephalus appendiculatus]